ncbi:UNVERIFIED_CONTAM: hypothetical protein Sangu_2816500 [Sesamum angustifolium]|uniref:Uncharacterized protein n=1 Tax=Sesamum angustifolium TaxID=2727405 RepID=A0AAW2IR56_9LAMI
MPGDYYSTKKLVKDLGLSIEKIHACKNGCILYWKDDVDLEYCKFCGDARYKPSRGRDPNWKKSLYPVLRVGVMCHPSDAEAWKYFDRMYPDFAEKPHNVRLYLCTDGFAPHGQYGRTYSSWKVIITPYNHPLDLLQLLHMGVRTYNHATDRVFTMRATLMWTVNDLHAYGMASEWSTAGIMGADFYPPQIPADSGAVGSYAVGANSSQAQHRPWDVPPPPAPPTSLLPSQAQRSNRDFLAAINNAVKGHYPHPWANILQIPQEHQLLWLATGGTAMMRACSRSSSRRPGSSCESSLPTPATSWPDRCAWLRRSGANLWGLGKPRISGDTTRTPVNQMEVFEEVYKKKDDGQWSDPRAEEVMIREENNSGELAPSSQASVTPNERQLWMLAVGGRKRGRVFGLSSKAHDTIAGPSQLSSSAAPTPSPPQLHDDLHDRV